MQEVSTFGNVTFSVKWRLRVRQLHLNKAVDVWNYSKVKSNTD